MEEEGGNEITKEEKRRGGKREKKHDFGCFVQYKGAPISMLNENFNKKIKEPLPHHMNYLGSFCLVAI